MKFGVVPVAEAVGTILAHGLLLPSGKLKKGHLISKTDLENMVAAGLNDITVARIETQDILEDEAATRLGALLQSDQIRAETAFTGRVNLYARHTGIFTADKEIITNLNRIDPAITLATLPDDHYVEAGRMIATVKIIPLAVEGQAQQLAADCIDGISVLAVHPLRPHKIGLVATKLPSLKPSTMDKTARILNQRLASSQSSVVEEIRVDHNTDAVAPAIKKLAESCDMVIVFGASAICDSNDVVPSAIRKSGGSVSRFGMPVDPGNLLLTGTLGNVPIIGAPGCARSPAENGFDWVLHRMLAGLPVDDDYITGLGVGGLLMEINIRPQPREG